MTGPSAGYWEVEIFNFQSMAHQVFELRPGLATMTGKSNAGKSAAVRAIDAALYNEWDRSYLRRGAKECVLRVRCIGEAHDVLGWERTRSDRLNSLTIAMRDGTERKYPKVGHDVPPELEAIGLAPVVVERGNDREIYNLNVLDQFAPLFLVTLNQSPLTSFIHKVFEIEKWERGLRAMNSDFQKLRVAYDARSLELIETEAGLVEKRAARDATQARISRLDESLAVLMRLRDKRAALQDAARFLDRVEQLGHQAATLSARARSLELLHGHLAMLSHALRRQSQFRLLEHAHAAAHAAHHAATAALHRLEPMEAPLGCLTASVRARLHLLRLSRDLDDASAATLLATEALGRLDRLHSLLPPLISGLARFARSVALGTALASHQSRSERSALQAARLQALAGPVLQVRAALRQYLDARGAYGRLHALDGAALAEGQSAQALEFLHQATAPIHALLGRLASASAAARAFDGLLRRVVHDQATVGRMEAVSPLLEQARHQLRVLIGVCPYCQTPLLDGDPRGVAQP